MPVPVTTLRAVLAQADQHFAARHTARARAGYEDLVQRAQERGDRPMQAIGHAMLGRIHLLRGDLDAARHEVDTGRRLADPDHVEAQGRVRGTAARLASKADSPAAVHKELVEYAGWAEHAGAHADLVDACLLAAEGSAEEMALAWLRRGIEHALDANWHEPLGPLYDALASHHERRGQLDDALDAWQQGLPYHRRYGSPRQLVAALWATGATACRVEDYPLARTVLEEAVAAADGQDDAAELVPLALADLAVVYEAAGDVIEARRLVLRSAHLAEQQDLRTHWPERWDTLRRQAERLELEL